MDLRVPLLCIALFGINVRISASNLIGQCVQINACACLFDDGSLVDLAPLSKNDGKPHFQYVSDAERNHKYFWNPCNPFSLGPADSACQDVAICMTSENRKKEETFYNLGRQESATFNFDDDGRMRLAYMNIGSVKRVSEIELKCLDPYQPDRFTIQNIIKKDNYTIKYVMLLESRYACRYVPERPTPSTRRTTIEPEPVGRCTKRSSCSCQYDDGSIVDLSPLSRSDGKPNFSNVTDTSRAEYYSWNPCLSFTYNEICHNVAVCMIREGIPFALFYDLGNQDTAQFLVDSNGTLKLTYTADRGNFKRVTEITLQCMSTSKFDFFVAEGEQPENNDTVIYKLLLASKYACAYAPVVETTSISATSSSVYNETLEPTFSTTSKPTPRLSSVFLDYSNISTHTYNGSTAVTTSPPDNNSPSLIGTAWTIICQVLLVQIFIR